MLQVQKRRKSDFATSHAFLGVRNLRTENGGKCELIFGYGIIIFDNNDSCNLGQPKVTYLKFQRRYVTMNPYFESLKAHIKANPPNFGDGESVLTMLYECYNENNPYDNEQIRADFHDLYQQMNGMPLQEMDQIVYPVCRLCRDHEKAGFIEGIRLGVLLVQELTEVQA